MASAVVIEARPPVTGERSSPAMRSRLDPWRPLVPTVSTLAALAWWVVVATRWWGGRQSGAVTGGAILTAIAVLAVRPDRVLPRSALLTASALSVAAFVVAAMSPTGWAGASNAADYACAGWTLVVVAASVMRNRAIVDPILGLVVLGAAVEVAEAWLPWWGAEDPTRAMTGTFYWWNPFAAYLIAGSVLGLAVWLRARGALAGFGLVSFVLGSVGLVYSTSRASDACFVLAVAIVGLSGLRSGWRGLRRVCIGLSVAVGVVWSVGGPPFFPHRSAPLAATAARGAHQSLGQNAGYRTEFWREALRLFGHHPLVGGGYHSLAFSSVNHVPKGWAVSPLAHSGYLQALSDGGLALAVPFLIGCGAIAVFVVLALVAALRNRDFSVAGFVLPLVLGALLAHSAVDFDWSYPADFVLTAILAGLVAGRRWAGRPGVVTSRRLAACAALVGVVTLGIAAGVARGGDLRLNLPASSASGTTR